MTPIYHLTTPDLWRRGGNDYRADSLTTEGFIHCSFAHQVAWAANRFYGSVQELLVLHIDPMKLVSPLKEEAGGPGGELFPHIHGPINREAVVAVEPLERGPDGEWVFSA